MLLRLSGSLFMGLLLCVHSTAAAQSGGTKSIVQHTVGTAGVASGGSYAISISASSPEAATATGGAYRLDGGFWLGAAPVVVGVPEFVPSRVSFLAPSPNPFASTTNLEFSLPTEGYVQLDVISLAGRRIRSVVSGLLPRGFHRATWSGSDERGTEVAAGVYFLRLRVGNEERTHRVVRVHH